MTTQNYIVPKFRIGLNPEKSSELKKIIGAGPDSKAKSTP